MTLKKNCKDITNLVKKNLTVLIRSKTSSLIIILGPLLIILFAGLAFDNTNTYSLKIGTYSPSETEIIKEFNKNLKEQFTLIEYKTKTECIDDIKEDEINTCIIFSENFTLSTPPYNEIKFYVDYSRINIVWNIMDVMTKKISSKVLEVSKNLTGSLLTTLENIQKEVGERRSIIVRLTTENDLINRNAANLAADLSEVDLSFNTDSFKTKELQSSLNKVKNWIDNSLRIGKESLEKASSFINTAGELAGDSAKTSLKNSIDKIIELRERLTKTEDLSAQEYSEFSRIINDLIGQIDTTKNQLNQADTSRKIGIRVLDAVRNLLDESLINLMEIQKSFNLIQNMIESIEIKSTEGITQPITTSIMPVSSKQTYLNYIFPMLIVLILMFTALIIVPLLILLEKNSQSAFRNFMTPVKDISFFSAIFITSLLILLLQSFIILSIASIFFSTQILGQLLQISLVLLLGTILFTAIGMIIGYIFHSEETAILAGVSISAIFIFLSNLIIPIESMPLIISKITNLNPFVIISETLRKVLIFNYSIPSIISKIFSILIYIIISIILALLFFFLNKKKSLKILIKKISPAIKYLKKRSI
jgi:ABC-2 type transport system permease protein